MTSLANVHPATGHVAVQNGLVGTLSGVANMFASFSRAISFARQCEAEFDRQGRISPETMQRLIDKV